MFAIKPSTAEVDMLLPQTVKCGGLLAEFPGDATASEAVIVAVVVLTAAGEGFVPGPIAFEAAVVAVVRSGAG
jgi:hypothetical protein